jgi:hypothetical protein
MPFPKKIRKQNECVEKGIYKSEKKYSEASSFDDIQFDYDFMLDRKEYLTNVTFAISKQIEEIGYIHKYDTCNQVILRDIYFDGVVFKSHELLLGICMRSGYKTDMFKHLSIMSTIDRLNEWLDSSYYRIELVRDLPISVSGYKYMLKLKW